MRCCPTLIEPLLPEPNPKGRKRRVDLRKITTGGRTAQAVASYLEFVDSIHGQRPPYSGNCSSMARLSSASAWVRVASRVRPSLLMTLQIPLCWMILISSVLLPSCCSLCIRDKRERIRKLFAIDSNFKQPSLNRTDRAPNEAALINSDQTLAVL